MKKIDKNITLIGFWRAFALAKNRLSTACLKKREAFKTRDLDDGRSSTEVWQDHSCLGEVLASMPFVQHYSISSSSYFDLFDGEYQMIIESGKRDTQDGGDHFCSLILCSNFGSSDGQIIEIASVTYVFHETKGTYRSIVLSELKDDYGTFLDTATSIAKLQDLIQRWINWVQKMVE